MGANYTMEAIINNSTNANLLPQDYLSPIQALGVDFAGQQAFNSSRDLYNWGVPELKQWLIFYLDYHNAVAQRLGQDF